MITAAWTAAPELAQLTTAPLALTLAGGAFWAADGLAAVAALLILAGAALVAGRCLRWAPRR